MYRAGDGSTVPFPAAKSRAEIKEIFGIESIDTGVFGGILIGLIAAGLRSYKPVLLFALKHRFPVLGVMFGLLFAVMAVALIDSFEDVRVVTDEPQSVTTVSDSIFSQYIVPFEAVSVLLLAALIGAIVVARKD